MKGALDESDSHNYHLSKSQKFNHRIDVVSFTIVYPILLMDVSSAQYRSLPDS